MKNYQKSIMLQTSQNNLGFSLYTIPFTCYLVTTLEIKIKSNRVY